MDGSHRKQRLVLKKLAEKVPLSNVEAGTACWNTPPAWLDATPPYMSVSYSFCGDGRACVCVWVVSGFGLC